MKNIKEIFKNTVKCLTEKNIHPNEAQLEVSLLIENVFNYTKKDLILNPDLKAPENKLKKFNSLVKKRIEKKIPVQYLINKAYFMGEELYVDENTLIPRPETEILVEEVLKKIADRKNTCLKIIDIGTGSGCIAIMLAKFLNKPEINNIKITASDISKKTLEIAEFNAKKLGIQHKIKFIYSNIFENIDKNEKFDVIVSNPPYISIKEKENLQIEVKKHEPFNALFTEDESGTSFYEKLAEQAVLRLNSNGFLAVEIGFSQAEPVKQIFEKNGFKHIKFINDLNNIKRVVIGYS